MSNITVSVRNDFFIFKVSHVILDYVQNSFTEGFFFKMHSFSFMCLSVACPCMYGRMRYVQCLRWPEEGVGSARAEGTEGCELPHGCGNQAWVLCENS